MSKDNKITDTFEVSPAAAKPVDVTSRGGLEKFSANATTAVLIDVRTRAEWNYVGVPDLAGSTRSRAWSNGRSSRACRSILSSSARFRRRLTDKTVPLLFLCRSGVRSVAAAKAMSAAGYSTCLNVADGFEGPLDAQGKRGATEDGRQRGFRGDRRESHSIADPRQQQQQRSLETNIVAGAGMEDGAGRKELEAQWARVCDRLRKEIGTRPSKTWFGEVELGELKDGKLRLYARPASSVTGSAATYGDRVGRLLAVGDARGEERRGESRPAAGPAPSNEIIAMPPVFPRRRTISRRCRAWARRSAAAPTSSRRRPKAAISFANFVVGKPNEFAYAAARNISEQDMPLPERNPLYIFGGVGLGKTHLMHAIWHVIRERDPRHRVLYLTAESFVNRFHPGAAHEEHRPVQGAVPQRSTC